MWESEDQQDSVALIVLGGVFPAICLLMCCLECGTRALARARVGVAEDIEQPLDVPIQYRQDRPPSPRNLGPSEIERVDLGRSRSQLNL